MEPDATLYRTNKQEVYDRISSLVHFADTVLAAGAAGPGAVSADLAAPAAFPDCRPGSGRSAGIDQSNYPAARPRAARPKTRLNGRFHNPGNETRKAPWMNAIFFPDGVTGSTRKFNSS